MVVESEVVRAPRFASRWPVAGVERSSCTERPRVLVADGSVFVRTMLKIQMESLNFDVIATVKDNKEASVKCLELKPDVIVVDIAIAEVDDFALIRAAQKSTPLSGFIVMIPDQPGLPEVVVEAVRAGAWGYIRKPISP